MLAIVILPDHLYCLWRLPEGDADNATRWRHIKSAFSRSIAPGEHRSVRRMHKAERGIWQRRYWEHLVADDQDLSRHVDYIHFNPVKHGHVERPADWRWSSIHRSIRRGDLDPPYEAGVGHVLTRAVAPSIESVAWRAG